MIGNPSTLMVKLTLTMSLMVKPCTVPMVRVCLIQDVRLLPDECVMTQVKLEKALDVTHVSNTQPSLLEPDHDKLSDIKMKAFDAVVQTADSGIAQLSLMNQLGMCRRIEKGMDIGKPVPVNVLSEDACSAGHSYDNKRESKMSIGTQSVAMVTGSTIDEVRKAKLKEHLEAEETNGLMAEEYEEIISCLERYYDVFGLLRVTEERQTY